MNRLNRTTHGIRRHIRLLDKAMKLSHQELCDPVFQWKLLGAGQAVLFVWLIQSSQHLASLTLLAVVVWGGAIICIEDWLDSVQLQPSRASVLAGSGILGYVSWRSTVVLDLDSFIYVMPILQGVAFALMARPFGRIAIFKDSLIVLSVFMLQPVFNAVLPNYDVSVLTGKFSQLTLLVFGVDAGVYGRVLSLGGGGVQIFNTCNSVDLMTQLTVIAIVFALAFPVRSLIGKMFFVASAPLVGMIVNSWRIALLAVINSSSVPYKTQVFDFFHEQWGALVFAGAATLFMGQIYMLMVEHDLRGRHG